MTAPAQTAPDRVAYVDGAYRPLSEATVSVLDRGFVFGDGIYEVAAVLGGRLVDNAAHLARLDRSLAAIAIPNPHTTVEWDALQAGLVARNALIEGLVYIQVTRGVAERDFAFPAAPTRPTVVLFTQAKSILRSVQAEKGVRAITVPDLRWKRRDIKSVALLAQVLAKQEAAAAGAAEAFMVEDGFVTEGGSSTPFIFTSERAIVTRPLSTAILPGVTRRAVLRLAAEERLRVEERLFTVEEMLAADEVFYTSATSFVMPVVQVDDTPIASGRPGPLTRRMRALYIELAGGGNGASEANRPA